MKPFFFIVIFLGLLYTPAQAQYIEFAPEGAVWTYVRREGGFGPAVFKQVQVIYYEDVLVDTLVCKHLLADEGGYYIYQSGEKIYNSWDGGSTFHLLWDFGVMPGDTFNVPSVNGWFGASPDGSTNYLCTGRDTAMVGGELLPQIYLKNLCSVFGNYEIVVNPRFGPMYLPDYGCPEYIFPSWPGCFTDVARSTLLSYRDITFPTITGCPVETNEHSEHSIESVTASPNPTTGQLFISNLPNDAIIRCTDSFGRLIFVQPYLNQPIDLASLPNGIYIVDIRIERQQFKKVKVFKM